MVDSIKSIGSEGNISQSELRPVSQQDTSTTRQISLSPEPYLASKDIESFDACIQTE